jgi:hypothetical protein
MLNNQPLPGRTMPTSDETPPFLDMLLQENADITHRHSLADLQRQR